MQYASWLSVNGNSTYVEKSLWPIIRLDLDYVAANWRQSTSVSFIVPRRRANEACLRFDLWEEINSTSFFTTAVQHRALREGSELAFRLERHAESRDYDIQAEGVLCFMQVCSGPFSESLYFPDMMNSTPSRFGIPATHTSLPTRAVDAPVWIRIRCSRQSTHLTLLPAATPSHSSHARTVPWPISGNTSIRSARSIPSTSRRRRATPLRRGDIPRTSTLVGMYVRRAVCTSRGSADLTFFFLTNSRGTSRLLPSRSNCTTRFSHGTASAQSR